MNTTYYLIPQDRSGEIVEITPETPWWVVDELRALAYERVDSLDEAVRLQRTSPED
jgi:hypothetical protein